MKKAAGLIVLSAACLMAASFWQKPYAEWSDKEVNKMLNDSPWAKSTSIEMSFPGSDVAPLPGGGGNGPQGGGGGFTPPSLEIQAIIESALPVRQALVRRKFGAEAGKSEDARKILNEEPKSYEIVLSGPLGMFVMGPPDQVSKNLTEVTSLSSAKSGAIKPEKIEVSKPGRTMEVLFVFPRTMPFTVEDQEVEFATKLGKSNLRYKFRLKDMVVNGKLEM